MKIILIYFICGMICSKSFAQNIFENTNWKTLYISGNKDLKSDIILYKDAANKLAGYHNMFFSKNRFTFNITAPCGNDCFLTSYGRFTIIENKIIIQQDSIIQNSFCEYKSELLTDTFYVVNDIVATRLLKNLNNEPQKDYFNEKYGEILQTNFESHNKILECFKVVYNRAYHALVINKDKQLLNTYKNELFMLINEFNDIYPENEKAEFTKKVIRPVHDLLLIK